MYIQTYDSNIFTKANINKFITDNHTLASVVMGQPSKFSAAIKFKDDLQTPVRIKKNRKLFKSEGALKYSQGKIKQVLNYLFEQKVNDKAMLAYIPKRNWLHILKEEAVGHDVVISFDIRKYYDNIYSQHIYNSFRKMGLNHKMATTFTKLSTVNIRGKYSLQQGSEVSPLISNIVGYYYFDRDIEKYLEGLKRVYPQLELKYKRYCDNLYIFLDGNIPNITENIKAEVKKIVGAGGFKTHTWNTVGKNHPKLAQRILGLNVGEKISVPKDKYQQVRGTLFNCIRDGVAYNIAKYYEKNGDDVHGNMLGVYHSDIHRKVNYMIDRWFSQMRGYINYVKQANSRQGMRLEKLLGAAGYLREKYTPVETPWFFIKMRGELPEEEFLLVKQYQNDTESVEDYLKKIKENT